MKKRGCRKNCRMKIVLSLAITASMTAALLMGCSGFSNARNGANDFRQFGCGISFSSDGPG